MDTSSRVDGSARGETVSDRVVFEVAERTDSEPVSLEPLSDVVDPDALDALFESSEFRPDSTPVRVAFTYCGCDVVVSGAGTVHASTSGHEYSIPRENL